MTLPGAHKRVLYITDKYGVSSGYTSAYNYLLFKAGIRPQQVTKANIYSLVAQPLKKKATEKTWKFNPDKLEEIRHAFDHKVHAFKPDLIILSDPACLGLINGGDLGTATLEKLRGGVYYYRDIPLVVAYPITAIHTKVDESLLRDIDEEEVTYQPYRQKSGAWILTRDFAKAGRILHGMQNKYPKFEYVVCRSLEDIKLAKQWLDDCKLIATDIETGGYPARITCIGFAGLKSNGSLRCFVVPFVDQASIAGDGLFWEEELEEYEAMRLVGLILNNDVPKTMHNGTYDISYLIKYRLGVANYIWDSMYLWFSIYMELKKNLDFVSSICLDNYQYWKDDIKEVDNQTIDPRQGVEGYWRYNALDCYNTLLNTLTLIRTIQGNARLTNNYKDTFARCLSGWSMSMRGIKADFERLNQIRSKLTTERDKALQLFRKIIDDPLFNINSPQQKVDLFYRVLGVPKRNARGRVIKGRGNPSTGAMALKMIRKDHPYFNYIVRHLQAAQEPDKQISNVCGIKLFTPRMRTNYTGVGTKTTRFSSKKSNFWDGTNVQNIRGSYRDWLVADENCLLLDVDYSQSDDVFVGYEANDKNKIEVICSGLDGHSIHGELFFGKPYAEIVEGKKLGLYEIVDPVVGIRQLSKRVVHGTNFMMAAVTLYITMGHDAVVAMAGHLGHPNPRSLTEEQLINLCNQLMLKYRKKYPRLTAKEWYADLLREIKETGGLTNAFGIYRRFLGDPDDNGTLREAAGFMGQSDTGSNMNRAQREIDFGLIPTSFRDGPNPDAKAKPLQMSLASHGFEFLLQTHDSFTVQLHLGHSNWKEAAYNLLHVMERPVIINGHTVSVRTEAEFGLRWGKKMNAWNTKDPYDLDRVISVSLGKE